MPTIYGDWFAGGEARIVCEYSQNYNADRTQVHFNASYKYQMAYSVSDSTNTWGVSGDNGSASGSNVAYSGPGTKEFHFQWGGWRRTNAAVSAWVDGIQAQGVKVSASFTLLTGALAPFINTIFESNVTQTSATFGVSSADGNGGTLTNLGIWYNETKSDSVGTYVEKGSWNAITISSFVGGKKYYYKLRAKNNTYGWGPWTAWGSITTLPGVKVNVSGTWKNAQPYVRVNGEWKKADRWVNVNGVWRR